MGRPTSRWRSKSWRLGITPPGSSATTPLPASCTGTSRARSSSRSATRDGTGRPPSPLWVGRRARGEPHGPRRHGLGHHRLHARQLVGGGGTLVGLLAHDVHPDRGVAHVAAVVERRAPSLDGVEVLREGLELVPGHARPTACRSSCPPRAGGCGPAATPARGGWGRWRSRSCRRRRSSRRGTTTA